MMSDTLAADANHKTPLVDPEIIHRFEEERALKALKFDPVTVDILEINVFADLPPSILKFSLHPAKLEAWIEEKSRPMQVCDSAKPLGALRLILAPSGNAQIPPSQFPVDHSMSNPSLPFSRQLYKLLCDRFHLPKATLGMLAYHTTTSSAPHFQVHSLASEGTVEGTKQSNNTADKIRITMKCRGSDLVGMKASVSVSHCRTTNITNALLFSHSPKQTAYIGDAVAGIAQLATHPAVIPTLLCNFHLDLLSRKLETTWNTLFDVEASSGQSGILLVTSTGLMPTGNCNDPNLSKKAIGAAQLAIAWETYAQSDFEFIAFINEFVASYDADPGTIQAQQTQVLKEYLSLVSQRGTMLLHGARHLRARAEVQASTPFGA